MKIYNRMLSLILVIAVLAGMLVLPAAAVDPEPVTGSGYAENPLYDYHADFEEASLCADDSEQSAAAERTAAAYVPASQAAAQLRDAMAARKTNFTLYIASEARPDFNAILRDAYSDEYAVSPETGDYLKWSWSKIRWDYAEVTKGGGEWNYSVKLAYYDTAEQEQTFISQLDRVMEELNVWEKSDYLKYQTIYDYILGHVSYDWEGLATHDDNNPDGYDEEYGVKTSVDVLGNDDNLIYTAYDALCCGKAVCQGYSCLFYAMCRSCGLSVRIQDGNNHTWNIVQLGESWYYMDTTWDSGYGTDSHIYFLKGSGDFYGHYPNSDYQTQAYTAAHPIAETAYEPQDSDYEKVLPFRDVSTEDYFYEPVCDTYAWGIFAGVSHYQFGPEEQMTRAMVVTVLYRLAGEPDCGTDSGFTDVDQNQYYADAITWAVQKGIAYGTSTTTFAPDAAVTREQFASFLSRYAEMMGYDVTPSGSLSAYTDVGEISDYAVDTMQWAVGKGLIYGTGDTTLSPKGTATRSQVATILDRFILYYGLKSVPGQMSLTAA